LASIRAGPGSPSWSSLAAVVVQRALMAAAAVEVVCASMPASAGSTRALSRGVRSRVQLAPASNVPTAQSSYLCRGGGFIPCLPRSPSWHQECSAHCMLSLTGVPCVLVMCNKRHPIYLSAHPPILHCTVHGRGLDATPMPNANNLVARRSAHAPSWSPGRVPRFGFPSIMQPPIRVVSQGFPSLRRERQPWLAPVAFDHSRPAPGSSWWKGESHE